MRKQSNRQNAAPAAQNARQDEMTMLPVAITPEVLDARKAQRGRSDSPSTPEIIAALAEAGGSVTGAARVCKCSRVTISSRIAAEPALQQARADGVAELVETAQASLAALVREGDTAAIALTYRYHGHQHGVHAEGQAAGKGGRAGGPQGTGGGIGDLDRDVRSARELTDDELTLLIRQWQEREATDRGAAGAILDALDPARGDAAAQVKAVRKIAVEYLAAQDERRAASAAAGTAM